MFKNNNLAKTLAKVNQFIEDLRAGVEVHTEEISIVNNQIKSLEDDKVSLQYEINQANRLIGTLSGNNS